MPSPAAKTKDMTSDKRKGIKSSVECTFFEKEQLTFSMSTASQMISATRSTGSLLTSFLNSRQAKSVCSPSSRLMSSFEKHSPGISPRFFSQNTAQKLPEKKMPCVVCREIKGKHRTNERA